MKQALEAATDFQSVATKATEEDNQIFKRATEEGRQVIDWRKQIFLVINSNLVISDAVDSRNAETAARQFNIKNKSQFSVESAGASTNYFLTSLVTLRK